MSINSLFFESSALNNIGITEVFFSIANEMLVNNNSLEQSIMLTAEEFKKNRRFKDRKDRCCNNQDFTLFNIIHVIVIINSLINILFIFE